VVQKSNSHSKYSLAAASCRRKRNKNKKASQGNLIGFFYNCRSTVATAFVETQYFCISPNNFIGLAHHLPPLTRQHEHQKTQSNHQPRLNKNLW
jgi:hypothetical protein